MNAFLILIILLPSLALAATGEKAKLACLDEVQKYEFPAEHGGMVPDSFWSEVMFRSPTNQFYKWDGKAIYKIIHETTDHGFTSANRDVKMWVRARAEINDTGLTRRSGVTSEELDQVLNGFISQSLSELHKRLNWKNLKSHRSFSVRNIVNSCAQVDGVFVTVRNRRIPIARYQKILIEKHPEI